MTSLVSPEQPVLCIPTRPTNMTVLTNACLTIDLDNSSLAGVRGISRRRREAVDFTLVLILLAVKVHHGRVLLATSCIQYLDIGA